MAMKIHLGCGEVALAGWVNVDIASAAADVCDDVRTLERFADGSAGVIYASHVLEHFGRHEVAEVLATWRRKLMDGGVLRLAVPDFDSIAAWYGRACDLRKAPELIGLTVGGQRNKYDFHKMIFDEPLLRGLLVDAGFREVRRWDWRTTEHSHVDDYSQAYLPHMGNEKGNEKGTQLLLGGRSGPTAQ